MPQDENQITHQFWRDVSYNLAQYEHQRDPSHNPRPRTARNHYPRRNNTQRGGRNHIQRKLVRTHGYYKALVGSGGSKNSNSNFIQIPPNSLNVMDYVQYKGYPYVLTSRRNGADYELGMDPHTMKSRQRQPNSNDLSSVHVALHPQFYYDDKGNKVKDDDGNPVRVTGKGAFTRFSEGYSSSNKNPIISMMQDTEGASFGQALKEYRKMTQEYGTHTKFDPLDKSMKLPYAPNGDTVKPNRNPKMDGPKGYDSQIQSNYDMGKEYQKVADLGHHLLTNTKIGEKPLQSLHDQGYTDQMIEDKKLGWFPDNNILSKATKKEIQHDAGIPIKSQLYVLDRDLNFSDRFNDQYIAPLSKGGRYTGIQGFDHEMQPTRKAQYSGNYAYNALGSTMNGINDEYKDSGKRFNRTDRAGMDFAQGYLRDVRGISQPTVKRLMETGMVRVGLGKQGDPKAAQEKDRVKERYRYLKQHRKEYIRTTGKQAYGKMKKEYPNYAPGPHPEKAQESLGKDALEKKEYKLQKDYMQKQRKGKSFPPYIEFPQYLSGNGQNGIAKGERAPVGADRIYFQPGTNYERNPNFGHDGKQVVKNSMHNYGYNINCGKDTSSTGKRELYVFEAPIDAISYIDLHRRELSENPNSCDILSLSGSGAKTRTISNFIYNKAAATGDHYDKVHFGTDNDVHGQQAITEYTEKARNHWPKGRVDHLFHGIVPPKVTDQAKDWNDVAKYTKSHPNEDVLNQHKKDYSMDEIRDKAVRDNLGQLSDKGIGHVDKIIKFSKNLYVDYVNQGESDYTNMDSGTIGQLGHEFDDMKHDHRSDAQAYHDFNRSIGESFNPYELDQSFEKQLVRTRQPTEERRMAYDSEHDPAIQEARRAQKVSRQAPTASNPRSSSPHKEERPTGEANTASENVHPQRPTSSYASQKNSRTTERTGDNPSHRPTPEEAAMPEENAPGGDDKRPKKHHRDTKASFRRKYFAREVQIKKQQKQQRAQDAAAQKPPKRTQVAQKQSQRPKRSPSHNVNQFGPSR